MYILEYRFPDQFSYSFSYFLRPSEIAADGSTLIGQVIEVKRDLEDLKAFIQEVNDELERHTGTPLAQGQKGNFMYMYCTGIHESVTLQIQTNMALQRVLLNGTSPWKTFSHYVIVTRSWKRKSKLWRIRC